MWIDYSEYGPENVKPGDKLRVVRLPVLQRTDPPAERESIKTVIATVEGRNKLVQLKEHKNKVGWCPALQVFPHCPAGDDERTSAADAIRNSRSDAVHHHRGVMREMAADWVEGACVL